LKTYDDTDDKSEIVKDDILKDDILKDDILKDDIHQRRF